MHVHTVPAQAQRSTIQHAGPKPQNLFFSLTLSVDWKKWEGSLQSWEFVAVPQDGLRADSQSLG